MKSRQDSTANHRFGPSGSFESRRPTCSDPGANSTQLAVSELKLLLRHHKGSSPGTLAIPDGSSLCHAEGVLAIRPTQLAWPWNSVLNLVGAIRSARSTRRMDGALRAHSEPVQMPVTRPWTQIHRVVRLESLVGSIRLPDSDLRVRAVLLTHRRITVRSQFSSSRDRSSTTGGVSA
jgi:hypothetical protein